MTFAHLQIRSGYSLMSSTVQVPKLIEHAKQLNFTALALTDEGVLHNVIPFYKACKEHGIKPVIGLVLPIIHEEMELEIVLLAKNNLGYQQLLSLSTQLHLTGSITLEDLAQYTAGLICIVSLHNAIFIPALQSGSVEEIQTVVRPLQNNFIKNDFYLGIPFDYEAQLRMNLTEIKNILLQSNIEIVALGDVRFVSESDHASYECLQAINRQETWSQEKLYRKNQHRYLSSQAEVANLFSEWPEVMNITAKIVEECNVSFDFNRQLLPKFPVPTGETATQYLTSLCNEALEQRYDSITAQMRERLSYELEIIDRLAFSDYFLIVSDFVKFAKSQEIIVGPGRGSAAGSFVAYLLKITNVDPLKYDLLFERFLNPERVTMPDIDIDFSDIRREEVIEYVRNKYGNEYVAQIITFGTFAARSLLRELMKAMQINEHDQKYILKHIAKDSHTRIIDNVKRSKDFADYIKQSDKLSLLFKIALKLEGLPRHISTHAAGIVIGHQPLVHDVPLIKAANDTYLTQYAMNELENIGMLKIDILGLRNLTTLERIIDMIARYEKISIHIDDIPLNDRATFKLLQKGLTNGVFQLESAGMKRVLQQLQPTSLDDIIALNALYRPGPMEHISTYINRKNGREPVSYIHIDLEPILNKTYGVLIYQEQIMQIAHSFAGLSLGEADILRRAVSKKNLALIETQREAFIAGCLQKGYSEQIANELFSWIVKFADYGFNKSHSVAYSIIAYQLAYLKANYPHYFFAQILNTTTSDSTNKLLMYVREANIFNIKILPPSINDSYAYFTVEKSTIRIGFMSIKGIGYETAQEIIVARKKGEFTNLYDFCLRTTLKRNTIETLILAGAFDKIHANRASLLASLDKGLEQRELFGSRDGQQSFFTEQIKQDVTYMEMTDFSSFQKLRDEKGLLQIYVSSHPLKQFRRQLTYDKYLPLEKLEKLPVNKQIKVAAIVQGLTKITTKRAESMAFATLADEMTEIEAVIFPSVYREVSPWLAEDKIVQVIGKISERNNEKQLIVNGLRELDLENDLQKDLKILYIKLNQETLQEALPFLRMLAKENRGKTPIIVYNSIEKSSYQLTENYHLNVTEMSLNKLKFFFGAENVVLK